MMETILNKPVMWDSTLPIRGAFLTCTEMFGNGSMTGKRNYLGLSLTNPEGAASGVHRVKRGGSWHNSAVESCVLLIAFHNVY